jgi:hypothetical protein
MAWYSGPLRPLSGRGCGEGWWGPGRAGPAQGGEAGGLKWRSCSCRCSLAGDVPYGACTPGAARRAGQAVGLLQASGRPGAADAAHIEEVDAGALVAAQLDDGQAAGGGCAGRGRGARPGRAPLPLLPLLPLPAPACLRAPRPSSCQQAYGSHSSLPHGTAASNIIASHPAHLPAVPRPPPAAPLLPAQRQQQLRRRPPCCCWRRHRAAPPAA